MRPIVLLTDFGNSDAYAGIMRGVIFREFPEARLMDLSHEVPPFQTIQAAYMLKSSISYFPQDSIFVAVIDPGVGTSRALLAVQTPNAFFLAPDNGVLDWALKGISRYTVRCIAKLPLKTPVSSTFHGRDILAPWAARLAKDAKVFTTMGPKVTTIQKLRLPHVKKSKSKICGEVLFFDHYGNAVTNIEKTLWPDAFWKQCSIQAGKDRINNLSTTYGPLSNKMTALINSANHLEIALPSGSLGNRLKAGDPVIVEKMK